MKMAPTFVLLAGPNGAGKTTLYEGFLKARYPRASFINADDYERECLQHISDPIERSGAARAWADAERAHHLTEGDSFISETVFSHKSKIALLDHARQAGFDTLLIIVCNDNIDLLIQRVAWRAAHGKHMVPADKIRQRYHRTLANLNIAIQNVHCALLFDNSGRPTAAGETEAVHRLIAVVRNGTIAERVTDAFPDWAGTILSRTIAAEHLTGK